jgi:mono/diheme cytochrome c family protein
MQNIRRGGSAIVATAVLACSAIFVGGAAGERAAPKQANPGNVAAGQIVFNNYFCSACHRLKAAGPAAHGILADLLQKTKFPYALVVAQVTNGISQREEYMPGYKAILTKKQIQDVSAFVAKYSGTKRKCTECAAEGTEQKASTP